MPRYLLTVAYDGKFFLGWQRQASDSLTSALKANARKENARKSVQATLEQAVFHFCQQKITLHAAGRTDQGVHALAQYAHLDLDLSRFAPQQRAPEDLLRDGVNFHLKPLPVVVKRVRAVSPIFHARFSATSREYLYRIVVSPTRPIFRAGKVWHRMTNARSQQRWGNNLEAGIARLQSSVCELQGENDFAAFRSSACQARSSVKRMYKAEVHHADDEIRLVFQASGFLYRQVRLMTGTLLAIAEQRMPEDSVRRLLKGETLASSSSASSSACLPRSPRFAAPAQGLYFVGATYDNFSEE